MVVCANKLWSRGIASSSSYIFFCIFRYKWHIPFTYTTSMEKNFEKDENAIIMMDLQDNSCKIIST